jgi:hypothetical protein
MEVSVSSLPPKCLVRVIRKGLGVSADDLAARRDDGSEEPEQDIAIKKVLQDKRFKVGPVVLDQRN